MLALASAAAVVVAAPPWDAWPLAPVALVPLLLAIRERTPRDAAWLAWLAGTAIAIGGMPWWPGLLVRFVEAPSVVAFALAAALYAWRGLLFAAWVLIAGRVASRGRVPWLVSAPLTILVLESYWPDVFPWHVGLTVWRVWPATQIAEVGGPAAVSALVVLANVLVADAVGAAAARRPLPREVRAGAAVLAVLLAAGSIRGLAVTAARRRAPTVRAAVVQPNLGILSAEARAARGLEYLRMLRNHTAAAARDGATLVVWPETTWPFLFDRRLAHDYPRDHPWHVTESTSPQVLFGALTHSFTTGRTWNSALLLDRTGRLLGRYDKRTLVPLAEWVPFGRTVPAIGDAIRARLPAWPAITAGASPRVLGDGAIRIAPAICAEELRANPPPPDANLLVGLANDAWFDGTAAATQHLALATFRAIESRRDLVHATGTGVSALVDARGSVVAATSPANGTDPVRPTRLTADAALVDVASAGPYTIPWVPRVSLAVLCALAIRRPGRNRRRRRRR